MKKFIVIFCLSFVCLFLFAFGGNQNINIKLHYASAKPLFDLYGSNDRGATYLVSSSSMSSGGEGVTLYGDIGNQGETAVAYFRVTQSESLARGNYALIISVSDFVLANRPTEKVPVNNILYSINNVPYRDVTVISYGDVSKIGVLSLTGKEVRFNVSFPGKKVSEGPVVDVRAEWVGSNLVPPGTYTSYVVLEQVVL